MSDENPTKRSFVRRHLKLVIFLTACLIFGLGGNYYIKHSTTKDTVRSGSSLSPDLFTSGEKNETGPVARVNGFEITRIDYQNSIRQMMLETELAGYNTEDSSVSSQVRAQALATLINTRLLVEAAEQAGVVITDEEVEDEYLVVEADMGGERKLKLMLNDMQLTDDDLHTDIKEQLMVNTHLATATTYNTVTVTDEEVSDHYARLKENIPDLAPFDHVKATIKSDLLQQKRQQIVSDYIQTLRAPAAIEILI